MRAIKNLFLISFLTVFACEGDYSLDLFGGGDDCKISLKPPLWIRGTWHNYDKDNYITDWVFTYIDVKNLPGGRGSAISVPNDQDGIPIDCTGWDSSTETTYKIESSISTNFTQVFTKIDNNTIEWEGSYYSRK